MTEVVPELDVWWLPSMREKWIGGVKEAGKRAVET